MSDENKTSAEEATETEETSEETARKAAPTSILTRDSDKAVRPGFRSPSNKNSKAQRKKRRKKR